MIAPRCDPLSRILTDIVAQLQFGSAPDRAWAEASRALAAAKEEEDVELYVAIDEHDLEPAGRPLDAKTQRELDEAVTTLAAR